MFNQYFQVLFNNFKLLMINDQIKKISFWKKNLLFRWLTEDTQKNEPLRKLRVKKKRKYVK